MIQGFHDDDTARLWRRERVPSIHPDLQRKAQRKLAVVDAADNLNDLRVPPGNHLEILHRDREGQHSIKVNDQYRICFTWTDAGPTDVEFTDYH